MVFRKQPLYQPGFTFRARRQVLVQASCLHRSVLYVGQAGRLHHNFPKLGGEPHFENQRLPRPKAEIEPGAMPTLRGHDPSHIRFPVMPTKRGHGTRRPKTKIARSKLAAFTEHSLAAQSANLYDVRVYNNFRLHFSKRECFTNHVMALVLILEAAKIPRVFRDISQTRIFFRKHGTTEKEEKCKRGFRAQFAQSGIAGIS